MTGKSHKTIGASTALILSTLIFQNLIWQALVTIIAYFSSTFPDIDQKGSKRFKKFKRYAIYAGMIAVLLTIIVVYINKDPLLLIWRDKVIFDFKTLNPYVALLNVGLFSWFALAMGINNSKHRGLAHSLTLYVTPYVIYVIMNLTTPDNLISEIIRKCLDGILIGTVAHIAADMLNGSGVQLFYPMKKSFNVADIDYDSFAEKVVVFSITLVAVWVTIIMLPKSINNTMEFILNIF